MRTLDGRGYWIPVMRLEIDYHLPALPDDLIRVDTTVLEITGASCTLGQQVVRIFDGETLMDAKVTLACLGPGKKARRLPREFVKALKRDSAER